MAVLSPVASISQNVDRIRYPDLSDIMSSRGEIIEEPVTRVVENIIYVAVGKDLKESKSTLVWALQNSGGKKIGIIHVHVPAQMIPLMGTKFPASSLKEQEVKAYREIERQNMLKILDEYLVLCRRMGVRAEKLYIEMDSIEKGIVELISQHDIRKLVMGAAADKSHSRRMMDLKSKKAIYVREQAPVSCHIHFICKGHLIYTREAVDGAVVEVKASPLQSTPSLNSETGPTHLRSQSVNLGQSNRVKLTNPAQDLFRRVRSANIEKSGGSIAESIDNSEELINPRGRTTAEVSYDEWDRSSRRSYSPGSNYSASSDVASVPLVRTARSESGSDLSALPHLKEDLHHSSPPSVLDGSIDEALYDHLEQALAEAENAKREAFHEAVRRGKAEKDAIDAIRRAKVSESSYADELRQRKEIEEALAKEREELNKIKNLHNEAMEELKAAHNQKTLLETQIEESNEMVKELEEKIFSAVELLKNYKKERDELQIERDNALREAEELRKKQGEATSTHMPQFFSEFSFAEIEEATHNFDPSLKIGEGGYGSIYKGLLRHTQVAIKMLNANSMQGPSEFQQEVDVLSKLRHSNLVTLVGACPEAWTLIYEYLPNGSLEDRLSCRDNTPPLSWQTRIRIAAELCSVLIFLHSSKPHSIVHGDVKPANILLDANFVSKLSDFGICRLLSRVESSSNNTTLCCRTDPKGTFAYMDPELLSTGELTPKSDVYSFGIILLRLLTGKQALGITKEVQYAIDAGKLKTLLDPLAGDWPFVQAEQLAHLALRCCEINRKSRADLSSDVWRMLEPMRASCRGSSSFRLGSEEHCQPPSYFICPIFQEVMQEPHVAADGFTYEAEALRGWLDSGHDTSPMTNLKLEHFSLVPNHALRSAIQEWLQQH
ncbi:U-box domain-containing protein 33 isoform X2 [Ziziphus jujuba]|uniref:RING-type E3 ubiquitin transferase n=1 Tax=Ziziphus jujuba TaxID=326968 RepID=A0ABM3I5S9_ZIZJJ|nr:U-box domain-containing protein 33 isoform X2 [Ziziphus jujuba]